MGYGGGGKKTDSVKSNVKIQPAVPQHSAALAHLSRQTFVDAYEKDNNEADFRAYVDEAFSEATIARELADANAAFFLATADDEWLGYIKLRGGTPPHQLTKPNAIELQRIYVYQHAIGRGVGAQLMQTAIGYT